PAAFSNRSKKTCSFGITLNMRGSRRRIRAAGRREGTFFFESWPGPDDRALMIGSPSGCELVQPVEIGRLAVPEPEAVRAPVDQSVSGNSLEHGRVAGEEDLGCRSSRGRALGKARHVPRGAQGPEEAAVDHEEAAAVLPDEESAELVRRAMVERIEHLEHAVAARLRLPLRLEEDRTR